MYLVDGDGVWTFERYGDAYVIHADIPSGQRGEAARESAKQAFRWIAENTDARQILAAIPTHNRPAHFMAAWAGMQFSHIEEDLRVYTYGLDHIIV